MQLLLLPFPDKCCPLYSISVTKHLAAVENIKTVQVIPVKKIVIFVFCSYSSFLEFFPLEALIQKDGSSVFL